MVGRRGSPRDRRSEIIAAARRDFGSSGYRGARMERIAELAGVNKQLPFHYFGSKEGLFSATLPSLLEALTPHLDPGLSPPEALRRSLEHIEAGAVRYPGTVAILAQRDSDYDFPRAAASAVSAWRTAMVRGLAAILSDGQRRGFFRDDIDPESTARSALATALGMAAAGHAAAAGVLSGTIYAEHCSWR